MPDIASIKFAEARRALEKSAGAAPEWFDRANDVIARTKNGDTILIHAILEGLKAAYEAGQAGKGLPPLKLVQPIATNAAAAKHAAAEIPPAQVGRVVRARTTTKPAPVVLAPPRRLVRSSIK